MSLPTPLLPPPAAPSPARVAPGARWRAWMRAPGLLLVLSIGLVLGAVALAYKDGVGNTFALDDAHTIVNNPSVRNLASVPRYFTDPRTFSTLSTNLDYRPVLQTTYAINHALARRLTLAEGQAPDGYDTRVWNLTNIAIHAWVSVCVMLLGRRLFGRGQLAPLPRLSSAQGDLCALAAGLLVAVHPAFSGAVNYISARSSTLVAALTLPVLLIYLRQLQTRRGGAWVALGCVLYALALLTKIEAVAMLGVLFVAEILLNPANRAWPILPRMVAASGFGRVLPYAVLSVLGVVLWAAMSPLQDSSTRAATGVTPLVYLATQTHAWWYYVGQLVAPVEQMTENLSYPVSWFGRSGHEPAFGFPEMLTLLALAGWLVVLAFTLRALRQLPGIALCVLGFAIMLLPHSSLVPLAEMVNEHRPYLSLCFLALAGVVGLSALGRWIVRPGAGTGVGTRGDAGGRAALALVAVLCVPLTLLTFERTRVWKSELTMWGDNARKQPAASRVQMNYGLALMSAGRYPEAERVLRESVRLSPTYAWARLNLGLCLAGMDRDEEAIAELDRAVAINASREVTHYWRGRFYAQRRRWDKAADDFRAAFELNPTATHGAALAVALGEQGLIGEARAVGDRVPPMDQPALEEERRNFRRWMGLDAPAPAPRPEPEAALRRGLDLMAVARYAEAEGEFRRALNLRPNWTPPVINLGIALNGQGDPEGAQAQFDRAVAMQPADHEAHFFRARFLAQQGRFSEAEQGFARAEQYADSAERRTRSRGYRIEALQDAELSGAGEALWLSTPEPDREAVTQARAEYRRVVRPR